MRCRKRKRSCGKKKKNGATLGMLLIAAGVIILCLFVLPHKVLLVIAAVALIAADVFSLKKRGNAETMERRMYTPGTSERERNCRE